MNFLIQIGETQVFSFISSNISTLSFHSFLQTCDNFTISLILLIVIYEWIKGMKAITPSSMRGMPINTSLLLTPVLYCFIIAWWNMKLLTDTKWCRKTRNNIIIIISWCPQESLESDLCCGQRNSPAPVHMDPWNLLSLLCYIILNDSQDNLLDQTIDLVQFPLWHFKLNCVFKCQMFKILFNQVSQSCLTTSEATKCIISD